MQQCGTHKTAPFYDAVFSPKISRETNILHPTITLQLLFVGCFYFVGFQIFKLPNPTRPKNIKYFNNY